MLAVMVLPTPGCADSSPAHSELANAVATGREALGLLVRVARFCGPAAEASAPAGECRLGTVSGPAGASFYEGDHEIVFRFIGADGRDDLSFRSHREGGVHETELTGRFQHAGRSHRIRAWSLGVARAGVAYEELEVASRVHVEGADRVLDLEEVRYQIRDGAMASFYRTYWNTWDTPVGKFELEDGLFEGVRGRDGRWRLHAEGVVERDGTHFADVEIGGHEDPRHAVVATPDGRISL